MPSTRVYLVNDTSTSANWGCRATTSAIRRLIESTGATIERTLYLSQMLSKQSVRLPNGDLLPAPYPKSALHLRRYAEYVRTGQLLPHVKEAIEACDLVYINGEGSIYDFQSKGLLQLFIIYVAKEMFGKTVVLGNFTAELTNAYAQDLARAVLPLCDDIVFREPISHRHVQRVVPELQMAVAADAAFGYHPASSSSWNELASRRSYFEHWPHDHGGLDLRKPYVCLAGSSIYYRADRPKYDPIPSFLELAIGLRARHLQVVCCVPDGKDGKIFEELAKALELPLVALNTPVQQAVDILGNASLLISGRWHPSILAATGGTPPIMLTANTHKTTALLEQLEVEAPTFEAVSLRGHVPEMLELVDDYLGQGARLRRQIRTRAEKLRQLARRNVQLLERFEAPVEEPSPPNSSSSQGATPPPSRLVVQAVVGSAPANLEIDAAWWQSTKFASVRQILARELNKPSVPLLRKLDVAPQPQGAYSAEALEAALLDDSTRFASCLTALAANKQVGTEWLLWVGQVLGAMQRWTYAERAFQSILAYRKKSRAAVLGLARVMLSVDDRERAIQYLARYTQLTPGVDKYVEKLGLAALREGKGKEALQSLDRLLTNAGGGTEATFRAFVDGLPGLLPAKDASAWLQRLADALPPRSSLAKEAALAAKALADPNSSSATPVADRRKELVLVCDHDSSVKSAVALRSAFEKKGWSARLFVCLDESSIAEASLDPTTIGGSWDNGSTEDFFLRNDLSKIDALHLGLAGPRVDLFLEALNHEFVRSKANQRPLVFGGFMGIACIGLMSGFMFRRALDLLYVNSAADHDVVASADLGGLSRPSLAVTGLPILDDAVRRRDHRSQDPRTILFACQPTLPDSRAQREYLLSRFVQWGLRRPDLDFKIKPRSRPEQRSLLKERNHFGTLFNELRHRGVAAPNVTLTYDPMSTLLAETSLLITISSTAAFEALAVGADIAILGDFGLRENYGNLYFMGSGAISSMDSMLEGHRPVLDPAWKERNVLADGLNTERVVDAVASALNDEELRSRRQKPLELAKAVLSYERWRTT